MFIEYISPVIVNEPLFMLFQIPVSYWLNDGYRFKDRETFDKFQSLIGEATSYYSTPLKTDFSKNFRNFNFSVKIREYDHSFSVTGIRKKECSLGSIKNQQNYMKIEVSLAHTKTIYGLL
jgi:hypothetical protein